MVFRCARLAVVLGVVCAGSQAQRLPGGVRPEHYAIALTPEIGLARFSGTETIDVVLDHPADSITLNAAEISFGRVFAAPETAPAPFCANAPDTAQVSLDGEKEQATLTFKCPLPAGKVTLSLDFTGILNNKLRGFYLSKTKLRGYAVTQFEATDARRAFPSFDEPALKATFDVALTVDAGDTAISNGPIVSDLPASAGKHTLTFARTPKMSTYLVAFLVGDFACSSGKVDGVPIRACATPDKVALTSFAVDAARYVLHYYDQYFGIKYPMPKLDMVAIPDFEAGAMENFGCITYRETDMLVDAKNGAIPAKKEVAETIAHEISHQWFGDMVTMQWWDNLWLNEGFATWMETKPVTKWHPEWNYPQDAAGDLDETLDLDAQPTTRPIRARAETPVEINEMFDGIAYGKGGAVISMVENYVGEELFRQGVRAYLSAHLYGNATAEDFWDAQTRVSGLPVDKVMASFVDRPGVPVVTLSPAASGTVPASQRRFFIQGSAPPDAAHPATGWTIPVCLKGAPCQVLGPNGGQLTLPPGALLYANAGDQGYFRTAYTPAQLAAIEARVETDLTPPERIGLLGDRWALMRAGQGTVGDFLDLLLALKNDANVAVLDSALGKLGVVGTRIASAPDRVLLDAIVRREFGPVYASLGQPAKHESYDRAQLRGSLFEALGDAKDPAVMAEAAAITDELFLGHKPEKPAITDAAVTLTVARGDTEMYGKLLAVARTAVDPDLKYDALRTLARFQDSDLVARTLDYASSGEVRNQDSWNLLTILLEQRETRDQAWTYIQAHWDRIAAQSTINSGARIVDATGSFCTAKQRDEVKDFFATHTVESSGRSLRKALDSIDECVRLQAAQQPNLRVWLEAHAH